MSIYYFAVHTRNARVSQTTRLAEEAIIFSSFTSEVWFGSFSCFHQVVLGLDCRQNHEKDHQDVHHHTYALKKSLLFLAGDKTFFFLFQRNISNKLKPCFLTISWKNEVTNMLNSIHTCLLGYLVKVLHIY
jgi:hypothetical protein